MHMISRKDLNATKMDTLSKSCSPTTVITANGEVQTHEEATLYVKELDIFLTMKVLEDTPAVLSLGKLCDEHGYSYEWINDQKPRLIKNGHRIQCKTVVPGFSASSSSSLPTSPPMTPSKQEIDHSKSSSSLSTSYDYVKRHEEKAKADMCGTDSDPASVSSSHVERQERGDPLCSDIPEWLHEFRENLVDDRVPEHRDSHASSSHEPSVEPKPTRSVDLGKHSVYTHFLKTKIARSVRGSKSQGPRAEDALAESYFVPKNFGDLITADHKVLSESCESRNNHRYAIVVQDFVTQWIQSYPCKTKFFEETQRSLQKFLEPNRNPEVIYTENSLNLAKLVKISPGIIVRRHHTDQKQMELLREQCAE